MSLSDRIKAAEKRPGSFTGCSVCSWYGAESFVPLSGLEKLEDGVVHRDPWVWTPPE